VVTSREQLGGRPGAPIAGVEPDAAERKTALEKKKRAGIGNSRAAEQAVPYGQGPVPVVLLQRLMRGQKIRAPSTARRCPARQRQAAEPKTRALVTSEQDGVLERGFSAWTTNIRTQSSFMGF